MTPFVHLTNYPNAAWFKEIRAQEQAHEHYPYVLCVVSMPVATTGVAQPGHITEAVHTGGREATLRRQIIDR